MYSSKLSKVDFYTNKPESEVFEAAYNDFKSTLQDKNTRIKLFNDFIFISLDKFSHNKPDSFWHICSFEKNKSYDVYPCTNTSRVHNCSSSYNNILAHINRKQCSYRALFIKWITEIIQLANENDPDIYIWLKTHTTSKGTHERLYIRFLHDSADYLIVLKIEEKKCWYTLITAFPLVYSYTKDKNTNHFNIYSDNEKLDLIKSGLRNYIGN